MTQPAPYDDLREQIEGLMSEGRVHSRQAGASAKVTTYWHIGDAVQRHIGNRPRVTTGLIFDRSIGLKLDTFAGPALGMR